MYSTEREQGRIFDIQRFCTGDGPGIRTTVFLKGCPLSCKWCHNPEAWSSQTEISYDAARCIGCGACAAVCPKKCHTVGEGGHAFDRSACIRCGACAEACPVALERVGRTAGADEVMETVLRDKIFYGETGGLTVSGGEPLMQPAFTRALLRAAKENGLTTCVETCGYARFEAIETIAPFTDIFLYDCKETSPARHREYTGVGNALILENLERLDGMGARIRLRCPLFPGINDSEEHFLAVAALAENYRSIEAVEIEPGHTVGAAKYGRMGYKRESLAFLPPDEEKISAWISFLSRHTSTPVRKS